MNKLLPIMLLMLTALSCQRKTIPIKESTLVKDSTIERIEYVKKDSLIYLPGSKVYIDVPVPCPDANVTANAANEHGVYAKAIVKNNRLQVDCGTDSLVKKISWLEAELTKQQYKHITTVKEIPVEVPVPAPYIPKWLLYALALSVGLNAWFFRTPIFSVVKKLLPW